LIRDRNVGDAAFTGVANAVAVRVFEYDSCYAARLSAEAEREREDKGGETMRGARMGESEVWHDENLSLRPTKCQPPFELVW
jgi:hypothetical protein